MRGQYSLETEVRGQYVPLYVTSCPLADVISVVTLERFLATDGFLAARWRHRHGRR